MPLYRVNTMMPNFVRIQQGYEEVTEYFRPLPIKTIWEWFTKNWDNWIDELACRWLERRKIINIARRPKGFKEQVEYTTFTVDTDKVVDAIRAYCYDYYNTCGRPIKYVLVGRDLYRICMQDHQLFSMQFPTDLIVPSTRIVFSGAQIVLVPHMEGILFLPDLPDPLRLPYE